MWTLQRPATSLNMNPRLANVNEKSWTLQRYQQRCGPLIRQDMVSRRRILSRSRDDLNMENFPQEEEDVWYIKDKLYKDHVQEVLDKWHQIDDEIWAKLIVMERNRRVAKAYARAPAIQISGSDDGFDGYRIGLNGFDNPMRDPRTEEVKRHIGQGIKVRMDNMGNILVKRVSKSNVYVKNTTEENSVGNDILKLPQAALDYEKGVLLFDMKKFQQNVHRELKRAYPDRRKLEMQCITSVAFVRNENEVLDCPIWIMIINVVAMDMLKSKLPPVKRADIRNRPRIPIPDEDPYSVAGSGSSGSSQNGTTTTKERKPNDKPPKLPPRDNGIYGSNIPKPDYDEVDENGFKPFPSTRNSKDKIPEKKYDDPYYCGLRARVPNFAKNKGTANGNNNSNKESIYESRKMNHVSSAGNFQNHMPNSQQGLMWHSRSYDSGMASLSSSTPPDIYRLWKAYPFERNPTSWVPPQPVYPESDLADSAYSRIYGRLPIPRSYVPLSPSRAAYYGEWD